MVLIASSTGGYAAAATPTARPGYHTVTVKKAGFTIAVPDDGWLTFDPAAKDFTTTIASAASTYPKLTSSLNFLAKPGSGVQLALLNVTAADFGSNLIVSAPPVPKSALANPPLAELALSAQMPDVQARKTKVAGTNGLIATGTLRSTKADGSPVVAYFTSYWFATNSGVESMAFTTSDDGQHDQAVQTMMHSLKLLH